MRSVYKATFVTSISFISLQILYLYKASWLINFYPTKKYVFYKCTIWHDLKDSWKIKKKWYRSYTHYYIYTESLYRSHFCLKFYSRSKFENMDFSHFSRKKSVIVKLSLIYKNCLGYSIFGAYNTLFARRWDAIASI